MLLIAIDMKSFCYNQIDDENVLVNATDIVKVQHYLTRLNESFFARRLGLNMIKMGPSIIRFISH